MLIKKERENDEMTTKEISRLIDWLKSHNFNGDEIESCIDYISQEYGNIKEKGE